VKFADLHLHTHYSDSTFSPRQLLSEAAHNGIYAVGIVDHDTVEGIAPSLAQAEAFGVEVIPGIELTTQYRGQEIHILGYCIRHQDVRLAERLARLKESRVQRVYRILEKLKAQGVVLDPGKVFSFAPQGTVGRMHIARALVEAGIVNSPAQAFASLIGDKCPAYVLGFELSPEEGIALIKEAGGIPVLAHPYLIRSDATLNALIDSGIMGLEVYYPEHSQSMVNFYLSLAGTRGLLVTGGSDCHGSAKPDIKVGTVRVEYTLVERLKEAQGSL
jgi:predicted metal-dependent phosphoesterase TrpH